MIACSNQNVALFRMSYRSPKSVSIAHRARSVIDLCANLSPNRTYQLNPGVLNRNENHIYHQTATTYTEVTKLQRNLLMSLNRTRPAENTKPQQKRQMSPNRNKIHGSHQTATNIWNNTQANTRAVRVYDIIHKQTPEQPECME